MNDSVLCFPVLGVLLCLFQKSEGAATLPTALAEQVIEREGKYYFFALIISIQAALSEAILSFLQTTKWSEGLPQQPSRETNTW